MYVFVKSVEMKLVICLYLNESDFDIVFDVSILIMNISHDKITQFTTEFNSSWTTSNDNTV